MRAIPGISASQFGVFSVPQARDAGWARGELRHAVQTEHLMVLRRGILAEPAECEKVWDQRRAEHRLAAAAAALAYPNALASHAAAAILLGLPVLRIPGAPCVTAAHQHAGSIIGVHLHRSGIARSERRAAGRFVVTSAARAAADLAREQGVAAGLVVADAALALGLADRDELVRAAARSARRPRVRNARAVAEFADGLSESALESVSRLRIHEFGLPAPKLQREIWIRGVYVRRVDFYFDDEGVAGEADGWEKYREDPEGLGREKQQQERLEGVGLPVIRWGARETRSFEDVEHRLRTAFRRGLPLAARGWEVRLPRPRLRAAG